MSGNQKIQLIAQILTIFRIIQSKILYLMSYYFQFLRKIAHRKEEPDHLLNVMRDIICLLPHFYHEESDSVIDLLKPTVSHVELISQNQPKCFCHKKRTLKHKALF